MKSYLIAIMTLILSSCIGDSMVMVNYQVKNKSQDTLYVKGHSLPTRPFEAQDDSIYVIPPKMKQTVQTTNKVCWFGDCRVHLKKDTLLDTLKIYKKTLNSVPVYIDKSDWKLRRTKAILKLKE